MENKGSSLVIPIAIAVSCESPVIIFIDTPEAMSVVTASFTPVLGGSMIPTRPRNVSCPNSGPEAKARTWEIIIKSEKENVNHKTIRIYFTKAGDHNTSQINDLYPLGSTLQEEYFLPYAFLFFLYFIEV